MRRDKPAVSTWEGLKVIHPNTAGLDIGSEEIWVAVAPGRTDAPVRKFGTFTPDLHALADHLIAYGGGFGGHGVDGGILDPGV